MSGVRIAAAPQGRPFAYVRKFRGYIADKKR
jgi:hypothetical protein